MKAIPALELVRKLNAAKIPVVLIGAKAVNILGSSRLSADMDWAARILDADRIIDLMYGIGYRLPVRILKDESVQWAKSAAQARKHASRAKLGALNFYLLDERGDAVDQIDFVFENPVPFAMLQRDARIVSKDPALASASAAHLIRMKEARIAKGDGKATDEADLAFLKGLP